MKKISTKFVFYFVIMEENVQDHMNLRRVLHTLVPQAIVESIYEIQDAIQFFKESKQFPHVLFLSEEMSKARLGLGTMGSNSLASIDKQPMVFLSKESSITKSEKYVYSRPYGASDLLNLFGSMNRKWLA